MSVLEMIFPVSVLRCLKITMPGLAADHFWLSWNGKRSYFQRNALAVWKIVESRFCTEKRMCNKFLHRVVVSVLNVRSWMTLSPCAFSGCTYFIHMNQTHAPWGCSNTLHACKVIWRVWHRLICSHCTQGMLLLKIGLEPLFGCA